MAVDERQPHRERLGHPDQGVVDRLVAVRVVLAHDLADDPLALDVGAVGAQPQLAHPEEDPPLDRLQPVARVREGAGVDDRVRVLEEGVAHLLLDVDVDDALLDRLVRWWSTRAAARHTGRCSLRGWGRPHLGPPAVGRSPDATHRSRAVGRHRSRRRPRAWRVSGARRTGPSGRPRPGAASAPLQRRALRAGHLVPERHHADDRPLPRDPERLVHLVVTLRRHPEEQRRRARRRWPSSSISSAAMPVSMSQ